MQALPLELGTEAFSRRKESRRIIIAPHRQREARLAEELKRRD